MEVRISNNLFLGVAELNRLKKSLGEEGWKRFIRNFIRKYGIIRNNDNTNFLPIKKSGVDEVLTIQPGIAFDADMNAIIIDTPIDISLPSSMLSGDNKYWIVIRYGSTHNEVGTVSVNSTGALTGTGTKFLEVLRGQPDFPTKVKFDSQVNLGTYEVISVASDNSAIIAGSFTQESDLKYSVVGTFTPGFIPNPEDAQIYEYDSYEISVVTATAMPMSVPVGYDFVICAVSYIKGVMNIEDYRLMFMLNEPYELSDENMIALSVNPLVTLVNENVVDVNEKGIMVELLMEHGFAITSFDLLATTAGYTFTINQGGCNYIDTSSTIPNGIFKGWWILNRNNMKYCEVSDSVNNVLYITDIVPEAVQDAANIVLIPPFNEIEYRVAVSNNVTIPSEPYYVRCSAENIKNRIMIPIFWKSVKNSVYANTITLTLSYRMIGFGKDKYPFNQATYTDHEGTVLSIASSSIQINVTELKPIATQHNYS